MLNNEVLEEDVCSLKIRTDGKVCILELQKDHMIKDVYREMNKLVTKKFKLMSNYPRRSYEEDEK